MSSTMSTPLSPDSQAFIELLERHLQEHDATAAPAPAPPPQEMPYHGFSSFPPDTKSPASAPAPAPSPNTVAALVNILQVQAQHGAVDPVAQQRQLVALLGGTWPPAPGQQQQLNAFAQMMIPTGTGTGTGNGNKGYGYQYPHPGIDTPEQSAEGDKPRKYSGGTDEGTPPGSSGSSPPAAAAAAAGTGGKKADDGKRKAGDEVIEGHRDHRSRRGDGGDSHDDDTEGEGDHSSPHTTKSKRTAKTSRRKSNGAGAGAGGMDAFVGKGDEDLDAKALKRKNQNRAAQKAFRERREQRVKDLEDKVNELEAKNAGNEFENENLRQLLAKLQQENMALKNTAFTFSMPMPHAMAKSSQSPPEPRLPPPPQPQPLQHRGESTCSSASGVSNTVRSTSGSMSRSPPDVQRATSASASASVSPFAAPPNVFNPEPFNAFAAATVPAPQSKAVRAGSGSSGGVGGAEGYTFGRAGEGLIQPASTTNQTTTTSSDWQSLLNNNFTMLAQAPEFMSFSDDAAFGNFGGYSDIWPGFSNADFSGAGQDANMSGIQSTLVDPSSSSAAGASNAFTTMHSRPSADDPLMSMADENMEEFLRSLGAGQTPAGAGPDGDVFDMTFAGGADDVGGNELLRGYVGGGGKASESSSLSSAPSVLSPGNYFTTSPDPSSASSVSAPMGKPHATSSSPEQGMDGAPAFRVSTFGAAAGEAKASMLRKDGTVVPCNKMFEEVVSKIPINSGFDLDDLCDHFKKKAVCNGQGPLIHEEDRDRILEEYAAERNIKLRTTTSTSPLSQAPVGNAGMFFQ